MKFCFGIFLFLLSSAVFNSCSNEIDVLGNYEETAVVYGLLDAGQPMQFIKINKTFMNPGNRAVDVAKIADSLFFDTLKPTLLEIGTGKIIPLYRANILLKDSGIFASSPNYLYVTTEKIDPKYSYKLEMQLPKTGKVVSAVTNICKAPTAIEPVSKNFPRIITLVPGGSMMVRFNTDFNSNSRIYDAFIYFNYEEVNKADTNIKVTKTLTWKILNYYRANSDQLNESVIYKIPSDIFYDKVKQNIHVDPTIFRRFKPCAVEFIAGNQELDNYIQASVPSIGIVQKQTTYTNVANGLGIFASRNTLRIDQAEVSNITKAFLRTDTTYSKLDFR